MHPFKTSVSISETQPSVAEETKQSPDDPIHHDLEPLNNNIKSALEQPVQQKPPVLQEEILRGSHRGFKTTKMLQMELDQLHKELKASRTTEEELKESLAEIQMDLASTRQADSISRQMASDDQAEIEELREMLKNEKLEADSRDAVYKDVKTLLQDQLTDAHIKLYEAQQEIKLHQLQLERKTAAANEQELEREEQIEAIQKKHEELEVEMSTAKAEQLNIQMILEARLVSADEREQEAYQQAKALQLQLQEITAASEQQELEISAQIESLGQDFEELSAERIHLAQAHLDAKTSLEATLRITGENCLKAQQQVAMLNSELQDQMAAATAEEFENQEQIRLSQTKLAASEDALASLNISMQKSEEELSRELATAQDSQQKENASNQELHSQLANTQQLIAQLQEELEAAQLRAAPKLSSRMFALLSCGAGLVCSNTKRV